MYENKFILGQDPDGGTFQWHRVKDDVVSDRPGTIYLTNCDKTICGYIEDEAVAEGHPHCPNC